MKQKMFFVMAAAGLLAFASAVIQGCANAPEPPPPERGYVWISSPRDDYSPGDVYRVTPEGIYFKVGNVGVKPNSGNITTRSIAQKSGWSLKSIFNAANITTDAVPAFLQASIQAEREVTIDSFNGTIEYIQDADHPALKAADLIARSTYRPEDQYYIIMETISTSNLNYKSTIQNQNDAEIISAIKPLLAGSGNLAFSNSENFSLNITFKHPLKVYYKPELLIKSNPANQDPAAKPIFRLYPADSKFQLPLSVIPGQSSINSNFTVQGGNNKITVNNLNVGTINQSGQTNLLYNSGNLNINNRQLTTAEKIYRWANITLKISLQNLITNKTYTYMGYLSPSHYSQIEEISIDDDRVKVQNLHWRYGEASRYSDFFKDASVSEDYGYTSSLIYALVSIDPSVFENMAQRGSNGIITSDQQAGIQVGLNAGNININSATKPSINLVYDLKNHPNNGNFTTAGRIKIDSSYPVGTLHVGVRGRTIQMFTVIPVKGGRSGGTMGGDENYRFRDIQSAYGEYGFIVVTSQSEDLQLDYRIE